MSEEYLLSIIRAQDAQLAEALLNLQRLASSVYVVAQQINRLNQRMLLIEARAACQQIEEDRTLN